MRGSFILNVFLLIVLAGGARAYADDWKTVETSQKNVPEWLAEDQKEGFLWAVVEARSLQEARSQAEKSLFSSIVQAVAANVTSVSRQESIEESVDGRISSKEEFATRLDVAAANLPFIKGVSLSEARQYWVCRENKKTHQKLYVLTVRYPMPEAELQKMRTEFEAYDREMVTRYERLLSGFQQVSSVEDINEAISGLQALQEYFFDPVRLAEATGLEKRYRDLFKSITLTYEQIGKNEFILRTQLRGAPFVTGKIPEVTSGCASRIKVTPNSDGASFTLTFSSEDCLDYEDNSLKATLRLSSARLSTDIHF